MIRIGIDENTGWTIAAMSLAAVLMSGIISLYLYNVQLDHRRVELAKFGLSANEIECAMGNSPQRCVISALTNVIDSQRKLLVKEDAK